VPRRILYIIDSLGRTGAATQLLVLAQGLLEQGLDVHVAALAGGGPLAAEFTAAGVSTAELHRRFAKDPVAYVRLQRLIARLRPDVIHAWNADAGPYAQSVASRAKAPQLIAAQHRIDPWRGNWRWFIERRLAQRTQRFTTGSVHVRDWCATHGLPAEKFVVIPPGVPPARTSDVSRQELLRELQLPADARLIGVVGRLVPVQRVQDLIWAADLLRVLHDNLRLLVIGDGPLRPQLQRYARLASDLDHIRFFGERPDVWRIMPHLDVLWNASEPTGHSLAILEAMAAGVPVVASDTPFNREFVIENETGYLIPLGSRAGRADRARHTDRIFTDHDLAARLATASRQRIAEHFSAGRMVCGYADLYSNGTRFPASN
jgi:glycosyltransferase involved in cell wall biosynthesis